MSHNLYVLQIDGHVIFPNTIVALEQQWPDFDANSVRIHLSSGTILTLEDRTVESVLEELSGLTQENIVVLSKENPA